jgi:hypothetical protein
MRIDEKIIKEIERYNSINKYIVEQAELEPAAALPAEEPAPGGDIPPPPAGDVPPGPGGDVPPGPGAPAPPAAPGATAPQAPPTVDVEKDPDVEELGKEEGDTGEGETEELDITDLVDTQKTMSDKQEEYFDNLFNQLSSLESKLGEMDNLVTKINDLETKLEKYRPKTPQEKLELRSLDSGPFQQKLSDFFVDKQEEMEKSGKNEYVLTTDDVEDFSPKEIEDTFEARDEDDFNKFK